MPSITDRLRAIRFQSAQRARALASAAAMGLAFTPPALAHDFWLMPDRFAAATGEPVVVNFKIGHGNEVESWTLRWDRVVSLRSYGPTVVEDQQAGITPSPKPDAPGFARLTLDEPGTHIIAFESYHSRSELDAAKFNDYIELEGLTVPSQHRARNKLEGRPGREVFSRRAKVLVQVGDIPTTNVTRPIGATLEIVPLQNPYALRPDEKLRVQVLYRGEPLESALIDITQLDAGKEPAQGARTAADGTASFIVPRSGSWKINVIWAETAPGRADSEYDTVFSSLVFGFPTAAQ